MERDGVRVILDYVMTEWRNLKPLGQAQPPLGLWIAAFAPVQEAAVDIGSPIVAAWFGDLRGTRERSVEAAVQQRKNVHAWAGVPYHQCGWVEFAGEVAGDRFYVGFHWGGRYGYGLWVQVDDAGVVHTSSHTWRS